MCPSDAGQMKALFANTKHAWYLARLHDGCCRLCFEISSSRHTFWTQHGFSLGRQAFMCFVDASEMRVCLLTPNMHGTWHDCRMDAADLVSRFLRHDEPFGPSTASIWAGMLSCVWLMQVKWGIVCKHQTCDGTWHDSMMDAADFVSRFHRHDTPFDPDRPSTA